MLRTPRRSAGDTFTISPPTKNKVNEGKAFSQPSEPSKVRKSIDNIEALSLQAISPKQTKANNDPSAPKPKARKATKKEKPESLSNQNKSKTAEGEACLMKAKHCINSCRTFKTELKEGALASVDRLFEIIKELEMELTSVKAGTSGELGRDPLHPPQLPVDMTNAADDALVSSLKQKNTVLEKGIKEMMKKMEEMKGSMEENRVKMDKLSTLLENNTTVAKPASYAAAVSRGITERTPETRALHSVVVSSKDTQDSGDEVMEKIRKTVDAKDGWVKVERTRKVKNRRVVVGCVSEEERNKVKERLKKNEGLIVEDVKNKNPLLAFRDVMKFDIADFVTAFTNQNADIFEGLKGDEKKVEIVFGMKARNPLQNHLVVRVSPQVWKRCMNVGYAHIGLGRVRVEDQSPLVQCFRCLGYGHTKRVCREEKERCSHCAGPHLRTACDKWPRREAPQCINCTRAKKGSVEHSALDKDCSERQRWDALARSASNLQRSQLATKELLLEATKRKASVALLQEPYIGGARSMRTYNGVRVYQSDGPGDGVVKACVVVFDDTLDVELHTRLSNNNIVVATLRTKAWEMIVVSFYFEPDKPVGPYLDHLMWIGRELGSDKMVLGGDANAKSPWWGGDKEDPRGREVSAVLEAMSLHILNTGDTPTFDTVRGGKRYSSYVDVTACSDDLLDRVGDWKVEESLTSSDHNGISFGIRQQKSTGTNIIRTTRIFNTQKANWTQFREKLTQLMSDRQLTLQAMDSIHSTQQIDEAIDRYTEVITQTCRDTMPTKKHTQKFTLSWWNDELAQMKKEVATRKRRIRNAAPDRRNRVVGLYLETKEKYEKAVKEAQVASWKEFCRKQDREGVWEGIYRVLNRVGGREEDLPLTRSGETLDARNSAELLAETFYPADLESDESEEHRRTRRRAESLYSEPPTGPDDPPFIIEELKRAIRSFNPKKAPGADGLTSDICQHAVDCNPEWFLALLNKCLTVGYFPEKWKQATVVVLRKPGRESYRVPKAYRPIGLLPVLGKIFEKMLVSRLRFYLLPKISPNQYGFMPQRSTEDALYRILEASRLYEIKKGVSYPALGDMEVERVASAIEDPHPAEQVELRFGMVDEDSYADVVDSHIHRIYTDGSKIEGRVGAALSVAGGTEVLSNLSNEDYLEWQVSSALY
ncbi:uncharacterized protein LOC121728089 [Aricia agestis]|uniref:uncharacterized protein LOC121728089 n=1 Tax=Aricia agestis TaxID=91739 RepID=UPI001C2043E8|nr:uncharacterized protein LOC121728089 [Aricia agestis]